MSKALDTITANVRYRGQYIGSVHVTRYADDSNTGYAIIDGRTRQVVYKLATQGTKKGTMQWHCTDY